MAAMRRLVVLALLAIGCGGPRKPPVRKVPLGRVGPNRPAGGTVLSAKAYGWDPENDDTARDQISRVVADRAGNLILAGTISGETVFEGRKLATTGISGFVVKLAPGGVALWAQKLDVSRAGGVAGL